MVLPLYIILLNHFCISCAHLHFRPFMNLLLHPLLLKQISSFDILCWLRCCSGSLLSLWDTLMVFYSRSRTLTIVFSIMGLFFVVFCSLVAQFITLQSWRVYGCDRITNVTPLQFLLVIYWLTSITSRSIIDLIIDHLQLPLCNYELIICGFSFRQVLRWVL